jgi:transposase-like protein
MAELLDRLLMHIERATRHVDRHPAYAAAISELKRSGELGRRCRCRPVLILNNIVEQDHRFINKRIAAALWFRSVAAAVREQPVQPPTPVSRTRKSGVIRRTGVRG